MEEGGGRRERANWTTGQATNRCEEGTLSGSPSQATDSAACVHACRCAVLRSQVLSSASESILHSALHCFPRSLFPPRRLAAAAEPSRAEGNSGLECEWSRVCVI